MVITICFRYRFSAFFRYCFRIDILGAAAESFARSTRGNGMGVLSRIVISLDAYVLSL